MTMLPILTVSGENMSSVPQSTLMVLQLQIARTAGLPVFLIVSLLMRRIQMDGKPAMSVHIEVQVTYVSNHLLRGHYHPHLEFQVMDVMSR